MAAVGDPSPFGNTLYKLGIGLSYSALEVPCTVHTWASSDNKVDGDPDLLTGDSTTALWFDLAVGRDFRLSWHLIHSPPSRFHIPACRTTFNAKKATSFTLRRRRKTIFVFFVSFRPTLTLIYNILRRSSNSICTTQPRQWNSHSVPKISSKTPNSGLVRRAIH